MAQPSWGVASFAGEHTNRASWRRTRMPFSISGPRGAAWSTGVFAAHLDADATVTGLSTSSHVRWSTT
eukprot:8539371-Alexandrium_andersonii.AAC.1